jgi:hypothetical protein
MKTQAQSSTALPFTRPEAGLNHQRAVVPLFRRRRFPSAIDPVGGASTMQLRAMDQVQRALAADAAIAPWWPGPEEPGTGAVVISSGDPDTGKVPSVSHWPAFAAWLTGTMVTT